MKIKAYFVRDISWIKPHAKYYDRCVLYRDKEGNLQWVIEELVNRKDLDPAIQIVGNNFSLREIFIDGGSSQDYISYREIHLKHPKFYLVISTIANVLVIIYTMVVLITIFSIIKLWILLSLKKLTSLVSRKK